MTESHVLQMLTPSVHATIIVAVATAATAAIGTPNQRMTDIIRPTTLP
jgi:hypothetical protein